MSKAARLRDLAAAGFDVPPFAVVPAAAFEAHRAALPPDATFEDVLAAPLPAAAAAAVRTALRALGEAADGPLAVRSSMAGEDGARFAFAGQLDTFLNVRGEDAVRDAVRACWASSLGPRVAAYRAAHGLGSEPALVEVILQRMIDPDAAGVLFTADPTSGDAGTLIVSAAAGLGDALVRGDASGQTWRIDRATLRSERVDGDGGPLLDAPRLAALAELGARVEARFGAPQDVEFAVAGDRLWVLQARPITTPVAGPRGDVAAGDDRAGARAAPNPTGATRSDRADPLDPIDGAPWILWDDSNIGESYSGAVAPLTRSVIRDAYGGVYAQFFALMGVPRADPHLLRALLGYRDGRVYYQLQNWYRALALLPGFEHNRRYMDQMMGVREAPAGGVADTRAGADEARGWRGAAARLRRATWAAGWLARALGLRLGSGRRVAAFLDTVEGVLAEHRTAARADGAALPPHALLARYRDLERRVLGAWRAPIVTDFFAMVSFGVLRELVERWVAPGEALHNDLLAGQGGVESLEPVRAIAALAAEVAGDGALLEAFGLADGAAGEPAPRDAEPAAVLARLDADPALAPFRARLDDYLARFGDRCPDELKLESPNLRDDPARLVRLIAAAVPGETGADSGAHASAVRAAAEARIARLGPLRRAVLHRVLAEARRHVRDREAMRLARARVFGALRDLFHDLGRGWAEAGVLDAADDVFFLTVGEAWDAVEGTAITRDLRGLVALRRAEHARDRAASPPRRFETVGPPYAAAAVVAAAAAAAPEGAVLHGIGCCSGHVEGRARVVRDPGGEPDLAGGILVAERTDPGWVFLFPRAAGILVERGSPLSHVAIVAREMGKPTIVGIPGLTARVRSGDRLRMDGARGEVVLLDQGDGAEQAPGAAV